MKSKDTIIFEIGVIIKKNYPEKARSEIHPVAKQIYEYMESAEEVEGKVGGVD